MRRAPATIPAQRASLAASAWGERIHLAVGSCGGIERQLERLLRRWQADLRRSTPEARIGLRCGLKMLESCAGRLPIELDAQAGKFFEQRVDGGAEGAGEQSAFVTRVEA